MPEIHDGEVQTINTYIKECTTAELCLPYPFLVCERIAQMSGQKLRTTDFAAFHNFIEQASCRLITGPDCFCKKQFALSCHRNDFFSLTCIQHECLFTQYMLSMLQTKAYVRVMMRMGSRYIDHLYKRVCNHFLIAAVCSSNTEAAGEFRSLSDTSGSYRIYLDSFHGSNCACHFFCNMSGTEYAYPELFHCFELYHTNIVKKGIDVAPVLKKTRLCTDIS